MADFQNLTRNTWYTIEDEPSEYKTPFHTREEAQQYAEEHSLDAGTIEKHELSTGLRDYTAAIVGRLDALGSSFEFAEGTPEDINEFKDELDTIRDALDEVEDAINGDQQIAEHEYVAHAKNPTYSTPPSSEE